MPIFLGLDCGGSSTRAMAVDESGTAVFRGQSGPANLVSTAQEVIVENLGAALKGCPAPDAVCGCFAGMIGEPQRELALSVLHDVLPGKPVRRVEPDYAAAFIACGPGTAACVVAGTGSIVCSRTEEGWARTGGYGFLIGDRGSASEVGRSVLRNFLDAPHLSGRKLRGAIEQVFGSLDRIDIVDRLYKVPSAAAALAKLAGAAADPSEIVNTQRPLIEEMHALMVLLKTHLEANPTSHNRVGLAGGLWKSGHIYREYFDFAGEKSGLARYETFILKKPPVEGAVELAKEMTIGN